MSTIKKDKKILTIKMICYCALFAAMSVVLSRFLGYAPIKDMRFSLESVPVFLSGMLSSRAFLPSTPSRFKRLRSSIQLRLLAERYRASA